MSDKYKNGKIYTIRYKNDDTLIYVGSTVQPLFKRWHQHKCRVNNENHKSYDISLHQKIKETNIEDWYIELYEDFSCNSKEQLNKREGEIIREIGTLNKRIEGRTKKEYTEDNKDKIKQYKKEYQEKNKDKILEKKKQYQQDNKDKIKEYYENNKGKLLEKKKQYQQDNKDKIKEYHKKYREKNKQIISEKMKEYYLKKKNNN
jgi:hypothetical protein